VFPPLVHPTCGLPRGPVSLWAPAIPLPPPLVVLRPRRSRAVPVTRLLPPVLNSPPSSLWPRQFPLSLPPVARCSLRPELSRLVSPSARAPRSPTATLPFGLARRFLPPPRLSAPVLLRRQPCRQRPPRFTVRSSLVLRALPLPPPQRLEVFPLLPMAALCFSSSPVPCRHLSPHRGLEPPRFLPAKRLPSRHATLPRPTPFLPVTLGALPLCCFLPLGLQHLRGPCPLQLSPPSPRAPHLPSATPFRLPCPVIQCCCCLQAVVNLPPSAFQFLRCRCPQAVALQAPRSWRPRHPKAALSRLPKFIKALHLRLPARGRSSSCFSKSVNPSPPAVLGNPRSPPGPCSRTLER